jgi:hypothetical protein
VILIVVCLRRRQVVGSQSDKSPLQSSTVIANPTYENRGASAKDTGNTNDGNEDTTYENAISPKQDTSYENVNKPTAVIHPVQQTSYAKEETTDFNQYASLSRPTDNCLAITIAVRSEGYDVLGVGDNGSNKAETSNGEPSPRPPSDGDASTYAEVENKNPNVSADVRTTVPPADNEYSYATPDVKRPIRQSLLLAKEEENEYAATDGPESSGYEEVVISAPEKTQSTGTGKDVYLEPAQERQTQSAVPPVTSEYSYARPDVKRPMTVDSDRLVIGPVVTKRKEEDGDVQDPEDDSYAVPDLLKNTDSIYATPDVKKPSPERFVVGNDEYAVSAKRITLPRTGQADKPAVKRIPSNPLRHYDEGEDQYAVAVKKPSPALKEAVESPSTAPDRYTVNESAYAVSSKLTGSLKRDRDRGAGVPPEPYLGGEDHYAVSTKSKSLPRSMKEAGDFTSAADDVDVQYAEVKK